MGIQNFLLKVEKIAEHFTDWPFAFSRVKEQKEDQKRPGEAE